ncbi:MAG: universal stress protein [Bacteroidales bacterium]|nr:MAG: universal stress protein [Bacteroidales bacterium]
METKPIKYLIPWDFTPVPEFALKYAVKFCKVSESSSLVELVHVVQAGGMFSKSKISEEEAREKFKIDQQRIKEKYGIEVKTTLLEGNLFDTISEYASEIQPIMVIMGTHGIKGVQKLTGSWALKVIAGSEIPFLVVQDEPVNDRVFEHIVMPIDFRDEEKEKIHWAIKVASQYGSKIHIIIPNAFDSGVQKKINYNLAFAKKHMEGYNIDSEIHNAAKGKSFQEEIVNLAVDIEADLILIMTTPNLDFTDYVFGAQEQYIIANNSKIPVMCVNPGTINR